jgi:hypothetical protein
MERGNYCLQMAKRYGHIGQSTRPIRPSQNRMLAGFAAPLEPM